MTEKNGLATYDTGRALAAEIERVVIENDLSKLSADERLRYYMAVCETLAIRWETCPFKYLNLNGKLTLYATKDCTDQLRTTRGISVRTLERERMDDLYIVTAYVETTDGRTDSAIGAVPIAGLKGEALANAFMKAETKAKRRATLSICGLGITDESEVGSIPDARSVEPALPALAPRAAKQQIDRATGEIREERVPTKLDRMKAKFEMLRAEGAALGLTAPILADDIDQESLEALGLEWVERIEKAKAAKEAEALGLPV